MNAFDRAKEVCNNLQLPSFHRQAIRELVRAVVLDAAEACEKREAGEALKCADQIRFNLLCQPGESVCLKCDGRGCTFCDNRGVTKSKNTVSR